MQTSQGQRTNNNVEGKHSKCKRFARKQEKARTEVSIAQLASGFQPPKRTKKFITTDKRIEELKKKFSQDTISLGEYVSAYTSI